MYKVKEVFYSLQGEGARQGRPAVFCRFSKCNLWNGREADRSGAVCDFCDTDIVGTDGQNGGEFENVTALVAHLSSFWPIGEKHKYVIFTGGEPLLQLDTTLIQAMQKAGFEVAVETNGTLPAPAGLDWICLSPKADSTIVLERCDELKLVYPQPLAQPERFASFPACHYYLSPKANPTVLVGEDPQKQENTRLAMDYCLKHPQWRLSLQLHKLLGID